MTWESYEPRVLKIDASMMNFWQDVPDTNFQIMLVSGDPISKVHVRAKNNRPVTPKRGRPPKEKS